MARLNVEDSFWLEVIQLVGKTGDQDRAIGNALRFFRHAQEKHKHGHLISEDEFKRLGFLEDLIPLFAERTSAGIKAIGAEKHFGWLAQKVEAGKAGGKASAAGRLAATGSSLPINAPNAEARPKRKQAKASAAEPSPSYSPSYSPSDSCSPSSVGDGLKEPHALAIEPSTTALVWRAYKSAYAERYKADPTWNGKVAGQLTQFTTRVPAKEAPNIAAFFVSHNGSRYVASGHAVGQLLMDAEKLRTEWLTGTKITTRDAHAAEFGDALKNQIKRLGGAS